MSIMQWVSGTSNIADNFDSFVSLVAGSVINGVRDVSGGEGTATAGFGLTIDGEAEQRVNTNNTTDSVTISDYNATDWMTNKPVSSIGDDYEVFTTVISSTPGNSDVLIGSVDSWVSLSVAKLWVLTDTSNNSPFLASRTIRLTIRNAASLVELATADIVLDATLTI